MPNTWTNRTILKCYFSGMTDLECELIAQAPEYANKYRSHKPFTSYANNVAQQSVISSLNKKLNEQLKNQK